MDIQKQLFETIRIKAGSRLCLGELICEVLDINIDAAYRRIRGRTRLSPEEMAKLCMHFDISMDRMLLRGGIDAVFDYNPAIRRVVIRPGSCTFS